MQQFSQVEHVKRSILFSNDLPNFTFHRISNCTTTRIYLWRMRPDWPRPDAYRASQAGLAEVRPAEKTMTGVPQLEQNRQVYSVEKGADAVSQTALPRQLSCATCFLRGLTSL